MHPQRYVFLIFSAGTFLLSNPLDELMVVDWPQDNTKRDGDNALPFRLVEDDPASEEAFARAQNWIEYCKSNHPNCLPNEDVPRPTRVLEVHSADLVSLFISNGRRSKYTALSHCWGNSSRINDQM